MSVFIHPQVLSLELACQDDRHYDTSTLSSLLSMFNKAKLKDKHFVICCTVMPGYVRHTGRYLIRDCENCTLSYNPEFIAQGDVINGLLKPVLQSSSRLSPPLVTLPLTENKHVYVCAVAARVAAGMLLHLLLLFLCLLLLLLYRAAGRERMPHHNPGSRCMSHHNSGSKCRTWCSSARAPRRLAICSRSCIAIWLKTLLPSRDCA